MIQKEQILFYLKELNSKLAAPGVKGEICLYGGAVMSLVYDARPSTKDVDAVFKPKQQLRQAIALMESPVHFRRRKIFVLENFLGRV